MSVVTLTGKLKLLLQHFVRPIVRAGENSVPEKERSALRNFNIIAAVTGMMVIVFGGIIYSIVPSTPFLIALILEASAFATLICLNYRGKYHYSKIGMYLTHCFSAVYFGAWLGEAMPVELIAAFLFVYLIGSSCQVYKAWESRAGFIAATIALWVVVYLNRSFKFIPAQHFPPEFLPIVTILCCGGMMVLMLFVTVNMIRQNDRLKQEAEEASLQKTNYVHETSHELRTPLNTIIGNTELLLDWERQLLTLRDGEAILEVINHLHDGGTIMRDIINNQLDMAKIEAGKFNELSLSEFSLHDLLDRSIDQHASLAKGKGVRIVRSYDRRVEEVKSDRLFILKITNNLLSNAIKFTLNNSEVTISTRLRGEEMELSFTNQSYVPEDKAALLFEQFHSERNLQTAGTGLGLAITKKLVEYLHGSVSVHTGPTHTRFTVRLPYVKAVAGDAAGTPAPEKLVVTPSNAVPVAEAPTQPLAGVKILIAEDDMMNQKLLEKILTLAGAQVACADTAEQAISQLAVYHPDVIISDHHMPGMGGIGLLEYLRHVHLHTPVIIASGSTSEEHVAHFQKAGAAAHILKPIDRNLLLAILSDVLEKYAEIL